MTATDLPIIDAHHHFWDLEGEGHYPWLQDEYDENFFLGEYNSLRQTFLPPQYREMTAGYNVVGTVHVEAERSRTEQNAETDFLTSVREKYGLPSAIVGHVGFLQPDRDAVLARHAENPLVKGIRSKPVTASAPGESLQGVAGTLHDPEWLAGLDSLEQFGFSWDLRVQYWHLLEAAEVVRARPGIPVILNHCGLPLDRSADGLARWEEGLRAVADNAHVTVKVSEMGLRGGVWDRESNQHVVRSVIDVFGWDRVLFASNLPVSSLAVTFDELVSTIVDAVPDASDQQLRKLFAENTRRTYRLDDETSLAPYSQSTPLDDKGAH